MQRRRGVEDQFACEEFGRTLAIGVLDNQRAAAAAEALDKLRDAIAANYDRGFADIFTAGVERELAMMQRFDRLDHGGLVN